MTARPDPDVAIASWLHDEAPERAPERLLTASRDRIRSTRQRRAWWPVRWTRPMTRTTLAAAAVVAVVALGGAFAMGGPSPAPSANPSPSLPGVVPPSSTPSATPPNPSASPRTTGVWITTGTMGTLAPATPRCGSSTAGCSSQAATPAMGRPGRDFRGVVRPGERDLVGHREHAQAPRWLPGTLLRDGKVLVGDVDDPAADPPVMGAEVYDPETGTWTATGKMVTPDEGSATLLRDGRVLVVHRSGSSELYDPDSGTWSATGQMLETGRHISRYRPAARWQGACGWRRRHGARGYRPNCTIRPRAPGPRSRA